MIITMYYDNKPDLMGPIAFMESFFGILVFKTTLTCLNYLFKILKLEWIDTSWLQVTENYYQLRHEEEQLPV